MQPTTIYAAFGRAVARARQDVGKTQEQLAREAGISRAALANIESGRQSVYVHHVIGIADALGISAGNLLPDRLSQMAKSPPAVSILTHDQLSAAQRREVSAAVERATKKQAPA